MAGEYEQDAVPIGAIRLEAATRSFNVQVDSGRTLKELLLRREHRGGPEAVPALRGVDLTIDPGETVAIVGRNGAGKSSTLRVLAGIVPLDSGRVRIGGQVAALLDLAAGFSRDFSGRENILMGGALYGLTRRQVEERLEDMIAFSELGEFVDLPLKAYSSGMLVRLAFAIVAFLDADVLLIDEVLAVGDGAFQRKCEERIAAQVASGSTLVLVSHDLALIERTCARTVLLDSGRVAADGPTAQVLSEYRHLLSGEAAPVRGTNHPAEVAAAAAAAGGGAEPPSDHEEPA
ncbi:ABC transporter related protein [Patulibacter medicamentivorans]|uniref:ABC transporter related protein n=1 Tax=Patulibacter medicamentivorans TaxID=1097667 RepID=H0E4D5_9ACTN|nr:ABC transporter ATP-binding protein [Patulibacter medicamentivorans]EHN11459.1 ABC transporter related protein [Patulibacter medicamentivorans]